MFLKTKKLISLVIVLSMILVMFAGCTKEEQTASSNTGQESTIILATTTSTENSGLLDYILPCFEEEKGIKVKVVAVGTGKALQMGRDGEADVLLVHAKSSEEEFVAEGHGTERHDVMYNDFVLIGPEDDPAKVSSNAKSDIIKAFTMIYDGKHKFVSRGDDSGTHKKEKAFWQEAGLSPEGDWYVSAGKGMGDVIQMANEMLAYTMSDRATYLSMRDKVELKILVEGDSKLFNQYGVIPVNPDKNDKINHEGAKAFVEWILSEKTQELIGEFGKDKFGQSLFIPNGK